MEEAARIVAGAAGAATSASGQGDDVGRGQLELGGHVHRVVVSVVMVGHGHDHERHVVETMVTKQCHCTRQRLNAEADGRHGAGGRSCWH